MRHPSISAIKYSLIFLSLSGLWACQYDLGDRTLDMEEATTVVVARNMVAVDSSTESASSCISVPASWPEPTNVEITGTAQIDGATQTFSTAPSRYTDGEIAINAHLKMNDRTWYCYIDETREFAYLENEETWEVIHSDSGGIQYTLTPDTEHGMAFTTLGFEDGGNENMPNDYYYNQMASHQILKNNTVTTHFEKISTTFKTENYDPTDDAFQVLKHDDSIYFVGSQDKALMTKMDGDYEVREIPKDSQIYLLNNQFIAFKSVHDTETHTVVSSEIQYSTDMINWSGPIDVSILNNVYAHTLSYDTKNGLYVVLNPATTQGQEKIYFTSPDLITWTPNTVGIWQNDKVVFSEDGRAVMGNLASIEPLMARTISGDWENVTQLPDTDNYLRYRDIIYANNRFHVLMYEYSSVGEGDEKEVTYENLYVGFSDDLIQWNWTSISTNESEILALSDLTALADNQIAINSGSYSNGSSGHIHISADNGISWNKSANPINSLNISNSVDSITHNYHIDSLINHNGTTYGKLTILPENNFKNESYFSTTDFTNFNLEFISNDSKFFTFNDSLYLNASAKNMSWDLYRKIESSEIAERAAIKANEEAEQGNLTQSEIDLLAAKEALSLAQENEQTIADELNEAKNNFQLTTDELSDLQTNIQTIEASSVVAQQTIDALLDLQTAMITLDVAITAMDLPGIIIAMDSLSATQEVINSLGIEILFTGESPTLQEVTEALTKAQADALEMGVELSNALADFLTLQEGLYALNEEVDSLKAELVQAQIETQAATDSLITAEAKAEADKETNTSSVDKEGSGQGSLSLIEVFILILLSTSSTVRRKLKNNLK